MIGGDKIRARLALIEMHHNVSILFAVESGSRAWGFASPDSDFDVRFIYREHPRDMIRLYPKPQVIEEMFEKDGPTPLDMVGWSLHKALHLGVASNPQLCEWVTHAPAYHEAQGFREDLRALTGLSSPRTLGHHYRGLARKTIAAYLEKDGDPIAKKYLYALRATLSSQYMVEHPYQGITPPILFSRLREAVSVPRNIRQEIDRLLEFKLAQEEGRARRRFPVLDLWLNEMQTYLVDRIPELPDPFISKDVAEDIFGRHAFGEVDAEDLPSPQVSQ